MQWSELTLQLIRAAREEDLGALGDITSNAVGGPDEPVVAHIVPRGGGVIAGLDLAPLICAEFGVFLESPLTMVPLGGARDGGDLRSLAAMAELRGRRRTVLIAERTLLNFLCRMCGVATLTRRYVEAARAANPAVTVLDTRKTLPGWREIDKYAVRCGGGANHRNGLYDAVLIKDNHLAGVPLERLAGHVFDMLNRVAEAGVKPAFVEVEVDALAQLLEIVKVVGVDVVLLDNFGCEGLREAVALRDQLGLRGRVLLEASGGVTLETIGEIASTGVDRISVGAITHSAVALDLGLDIVGCEA